MYALDPNSSTRAHAPAVPPVRREPCHDDRADAGYGEAIGAPRGLVYTRLAWTPGDGGLWRPALLAAAGGGNECCAGRSASDGVACDACSSLATSELFALRERARWPGISNGRFAPRGRDGQASAVGGSLLEGEMARPQQWEVRSSRARWPGLSSGRFAPP
jgi:hypothetical protein